MPEYTYVPGYLSKAEIVRGLIVRVKDEFGITDDKKAKDLLYDAIGANEENLIAYLKQGMKRS